MSRSKYDCQKNLRDQYKWPQEQLAELCGLNVRTIQRVESGSKASLETLKSLASVFEVDISRLTEEITVIDKESEDWKSLPWFYRANMVGIKTRGSAVTIEFLLVFIAFAFLPFGDTVRAIGFLIAAYIVGAFIRFGDYKKIW
jgi:transcriptional regulator with XRE-family HTH domain